MDHALQDDTPVQDGLEFNLHDSFTASCTAVQNAACHAVPCQIETYCNLSCLLGQFQHLLLVSNIVLAEMNKIA